MSRNDPCWCGSGKKYKKCHYPQTPPFTNDLAKIYLKQFGILIKTPHQIEKIRKASKTAATILKLLCEKAQKGITTLQLDQYSRKLHKEMNAIPAPLNYGHPPFPKTICTSINEVICHGIPEERPLLEGDIINIDVTSIVDGYYGDCSKMVMIGKVSEDKKRVVETSYECLMESIAICKPNVMLYEIGDVIETIAKKHHCSVVDQFVGHGIGVGFHEPPQVAHHYNDLAIPLAPGMTFTIEPMINAGVKEAVIDPKDQWTARTKDLKPSAQWEHTILITDNGHEILTLAD
ncbi:MAG TPA: methionyl aminopeptidase [Chlamydiales bacterium]|nr:methionyl aminopeptidase [Chlamydiales bacterium]